jgi:hypothetical protein
VRFEDLCAEPVEQITAILEFDGAGNGGRAAELARFVSPPSGLGKWRGADPSLVAEATAIAGAQLAQFGYPI